MIRNDVMFRETSKMNPFTLKLAELVFHQGSQRVVTRHQGYVIVDEYLADENTFVGRYGVPSDMNETSWRADGSSDLESTLDLCYMEESRK